MVCLHEESPRWDRPPRQRPAAGRSSFSLLADVASLLRCFPRTTLPNLAHKLRFAALARPRWSKTSRLISSRNPYSLVVVLLPGSRWASSLADHTATGFFRARGNNMPLASAREHVNVDPHAEQAVLRICNYELQKSCIRAELRRSVKLGLR